MAAVEGIGCSPAYIHLKKKKKKKKNILSKAPGFLVWIADSTLWYIFTHNKLFLRLMVSKEAISLVEVWLHRTKQCHWVICLLGNPKAVC